MDIPDPTLKKRNQEMTKLISIISAAGEGEFSFQREGTLKLWEQINKRVYNLFLWPVEQVNYFGGWAESAKSIWCQKVADGPTYLRGPNKILNFFLVWGVGWGIRQCFKTCVPQVKTCKKELYNNEFCNIFRLDIYCAVYFIDMIHFPSL